mmetsp:Transcript_23738/g.35246  ORF Transcript_23738/g.35246 Transcript_23738/m.35246 type:complete len:261 (+) Transcript_23738:501-1283(+)
MLSIKTFLHGIHPLLIPWPPCSMQVLSIKTFLDGIHPLLLKWTSCSKEQVLSIKMFLDGILPRLLTWPTCSMEQVLSTRTSVHGRMTSLMTMRWISSLVQAALTKRLQLQIKVHFVLVLLRNAKPTPLSLPCPQSRLQSRPPTRLQTRPPTRLHLMLLPPFPVGPLSLTRSAVTSTRTVKVKSPHLTRLELAVPTKLRFSRKDARKRSLMLSLPLPTLLLPLKVILPIQTFKSLWTFRRIPLRTVTSLMETLLSCVSGLD